MVWVLCVVLVVLMIKTRGSLSCQAPEMHLIRVAEHLGASSRRPRHPFPALMAGEPWPCTCVHGPKKPSRHTMKCNCGDLRRFLHVCTHDLDGHVTVQIHLPLLTATLVLQREPGIVVVVWANIVIAAETIIEYANTHNVEGTGCN